MYYEELISINSLDKIKSYFFYNDKPYITHGSEPIAINTFNCIANYNRIHINKNNTVHSEITIPIENVEKGDKVTVEFECLALTPALTDGLMRVSFSEIEAIDNTKTPALKHYVDVLHNDNKWQKVSVDYMFACDTYDKYLIDIGVPWWKTANTFMRNVKLKISRQNKKNMDILKSYKLKNNAGVWEIRSDFPNAGGVLTTRNANSLILTFKKPFSLRPTGVATMDKEGTGYAYRPVVQYEGQQSIDISFVDSAGVLMELTAMPNNAHCSILIFGKE